MKVRIKVLEDKIRYMTEYTRHKIDEKDWHAVADGAMDIREHEAQIVLLKELQGE